MAINDKIRVVVDPNIIASVLIGGSTRTRFDWLLANNDQFELCYADKMLDEVRQFPTKDYFKKTGITADLVTDFIRIFQAIALKVIVTSTVKLGRDANDYYLLSLCRDARASFLITGDPDLIQINPYGPTQIVTMKTFVELFRTTPPTQPSTL